MFRCVEENLHLNIRKLFFLQINKESTSGNPHPSKVYLNAEVKFACPQKTYASVHSNVDSTLVPEANRVLFPSMGSATADKIQ